MVTFQIVYPIRVNQKEFYAVIEKIGKNEYNVSLYLGDTEIKPPKKIKADSIKKLIIILKHEMERIFFTELPNYVQEIGE